MVSRVTDAVIMALFEDFFVICACDDAVHFCIFDAVHKNGFWISETKLDRISMASKENFGSLFDMTLAYSLGKRKNGCHHRILRHKLSVKHT